MNVGAAWKEMHGIMAACMDRLPIEVGRAIEGIKHQDSRLKH